MTDQADAREEPATVDENDTGGLPPGLDEIDEIDEVTDRNLVNLLAGRAGYVIPRTPPGEEHSVYHLTPNGVTWDHVTRDGPVRERIASRPFLVRCELLNDHGDYSYTVVWQTSRGSVREMTLPAAVISDSRTTTRVVTTPTQGVPRFHIVKNATQGAALTTSSKSASPPCACST